MAQRPVVGFVFVLALLILLVVYSTRTAGRATNTLFETQGAQEEESVPQTVNLPVSAPSVEETTTEEESVPQTVALPFSSPSVEEPPTDDPTAGDGLADWEPSEGIIRSAALDAPSTDAAAYNNFARTFGKSKSAARQTTFARNRAAMRAQNRRGGQWVAGLNQFSDMSDEEFRTTVLNPQLSVEPVPEEDQAPDGGRRLLSEELPTNVSAQAEHLMAADEFTWVGSGRLPAVSDQGQCGSCYAHSSATTIAAWVAIAQNKAPVPLSRMQLMTCTTGNPGCNGGSPYRMFQYAASNGVASDARYPYTPKNSVCNTGLTTPYSAKTTNVRSIANNELAFKAALASGPIAITLGASTWNNYAGGIFTNCAANIGIDHAVTLVGYGVDPALGKYWLIQNSWNTWWGEKGFIRLPRTDSSVAGVGMCGMTRYAGYVPVGPYSTGDSSSPCQGSWSAWSTCSKTCGGGTQSQTWTTTAQPQGGGTPCPNPTTVTQSCNTQACPSNNVNCQGSWSAWSTCSKSCGGGTQTQTWTTTVPAQGTGTPCPSPTTNSRTCNTQACTTNVNCQGSWGIWSTCTKSCGGGTQTQSWTTTVPAQGTGTPCPSPTTASRSCNTQACSNVACQGSWGIWSTCSKSCGGGTQTQTWTTTAPAQGSGTPCPSPTTNSRTCNTQACPSNNTQPVTCVRFNWPSLPQASGAYQLQSTVYNQGFCGARNTVFRLPNTNFYLFSYWMLCSSNTCGKLAWGMGAEPNAGQGSGYIWSAASSPCSAAFYASPLAASWSASGATVTTC